MRGLPDREEWEVWEVYPTRSSFDLLMEDVRLFVWSNRPSWLYRKLRLESKFRAHAEWRNSGSADWVRGSRTWPRG
jgi:hypothetical protein